MIYTYAIMSDKPSTVKIFENIVIIFKNLFGMVHILVRALVLARKNKVLVF